MKKSEERLPLVRSHQQEKEHVYVGLGVACCVLRGGVLADGGWW
jgi:hypothetical protein